MNDAKVVTDAQYLMAQAAGDLARTADRLRRAERRMMRTADYRAAVRRLAVEPYSVSSVPWEAAETCAEAARELRLLSRDLGRDARLTPARVACGNAHLRQHVRVAS